jgi:hypothetical protein
MYDLLCGFNGKFEFQIQGIFFGGEFSLFWDIFHKHLKNHGSLLPK